ncbi:TLC domain-containing protein 3A isoform X2 [Spodoptera frugiperda]|uniref:TLC domain-containing protein 3A isoform X2 n=2 Tax=Spodoptera frugiperda TaxID=7108 RepID=A0A9R0DDA1_SPOFR|nr:TLC domain-containing protein 3A isoform X2 [Spodoptera frugiperda]
MDAAVSKTKHRAAIGMLAVCNAGSLVAATNLVISLNPEDKITIKRGAALTALGFVYFMTLFELLNSLALSTGAGARFRHKYRLSCGDVLDITNKFVSAVQAALSCVTGAIVCLWSCTRDFMRSSHYMSEAYAWFGAAYFFYDIWSMYMVHVQMNSNPEVSTLKRRPSKNGSAPLSSGDGVVLKKQGTTFLDYCKHEPVILMHHLFIGGFGFLVIVYLRGNLGDCTFGFVYLMELSTPFVSARGILSRMRLKSSRLYIVNGILMLLTFFVCRVLSLPYVCLLYSRVIGLSYVDAIRSLPTGCKISICILLLPQLYWFYLMSSGALKMLFGTDKKTASLSCGDINTSGVSCGGCGECDKCSAVSGAKPHKRS